MVQGRFDPLSDPPRGPRNRLFKDTFYGAKEIDDMKIKDKPACVKKAKVFCEECENLCKEFQENIEHPSEWSYWCNAPDNLKYSDKSDDDWLKRGKSEISGRKNKPSVMNKDNDCKLFLKKESD